MPAGSEAQTAGLGAANRVGEVLFPLEGSGPTSGELIRLDDARVNDVAVGIPAARTPRHASIGLRSGDSAETGHAPEVGRRRNVHELHVLNQSRNVPSTDKNFHPDETNVRALETTADKVNSVMDLSDNLLSFTAIRGVQAGREYYVAMCPLKVIPKIFLFDEVELAPELRAQRTLNKARVPEIAGYLVENPRSYIFSSITASIDGETRFEPFGEGGPASNAGRLLVPMTARFLISDGQHRRAAIEMALKESPDLGEESLSVVFFIDGGLKRSQQMFADLNRHAIRPTKSIGILYDRRDALSQLACRLAETVSVFKNLVEMEKTSIPNRSNRLFTLSSIYQATRTLLAKPKKGKVSDKEEQLTTDFWEAVAKVIPDWQLAAQKKVSCAELRRDYVHAHGIALQALATAGATLIAEQPRGWKRRLESLAGIDWSRSNADVWEGRALVGGRVSKAHTSIVLTANLLKSKLGLSLGAREKELENRFSRGRRAA